MHERDRVWGEWELGEVPASVVEVEASDGGTNCRRDAEQKLIFF